VSKKIPYFWASAFCSLAAVSGFGKAATSSPSLIPSLAELKPAIFCLDDASSQSRILECLSLQGITDDYRYPRQPTTVEDFKQQVLVMWSAVGQGGNSRLSAQQFDAALDYATCIGDATNALKGLKIEGDPRNAVGVGRTKADMSCADKALSPLSTLKRNPGISKGEFGALPEGEAKAYMLAAIFSGAAYNYGVEANGWVTDDMRPCVIRADGTRSIGCKANPPPKFAPPPLPSPPRLNR
jgi:hypothetical protein